MDNIRNGERIENLDIKKLKQHYENRYQIAH